MYTVISYSFEWDEAKNKLNRKKHELWFEEARQVFQDPLAIRFSDPGHYEQEDRFVILGMSQSNRVLVVIFTEREDPGKVIRLISARKATAGERKNYEKGI